MGWAGAWQSGGVGAASPPAAGASRPGRPRLRWARGERGTGAYPAPMCYQGALVRTRAGGQVRAPAGSEHAHAPAVAVNPQAAPSNAGACDGHCCQGNAHTARALEDRSPATGGTCGGPDQGAALFRRAHAGSGRCRPRCQFGGASASAGAQVLGARGLAHTLAAAVAAPPVQRAIARWPAFLPAPGIYYVPCSHQLA